MSNRSTISWRLVIASINARAYAFPFAPWSILRSHDVISWSFVVSGTCVIGLQWGDEAKGKLVDLLAPQFDLVVRYQGGANAGHTVVAGDETYKLHHIPSGILHRKVQNLITPGVVINPSTMLDEIDALAARGIVCKDNLRISERAHLVMPWHMAEDKFINATVVRGESIGTTNRGIGPCYRDKVGRTHAIRMADLVQPTRDERIRTVAEQKVALLTIIGRTERGPRFDRAGSRGRAGNLMGRAARGHGG